MHRYAIYYLPPPGALAMFAAAWLGWDVAVGRSVPLAGPAGLPLEQALIVAEPQKYGFHATLKPPFRLAEGETEAGLRQAAQELADQLAPVTLPGLTLAAVGRFLALVPEGPAEPLNALAARAVAALDRFRAPAGSAELARRREAGLTPRQDALLERWGYPYVMEEFRFHLTLSGPLAEDHRPAVRAALAPALEPLLPRPFELAQIALVGSEADGRFRLLHRYPLTG